MLDCWNMCIHKPSPQVHLGSQNKSYQVDRAWLDKIDRTCNDRISMQAVLLPGSMENWGGRRGHFLQVCSWAAHRCPAMLFAFSSALLLCLPAPCPAGWLCAPAAHAVHCLLPPLPMFCAYSNSLLFPPSFLGGRYSL